jgi:hypothetical protein
MGMTYLLCILVVALGYVIISEHQNLNRAERVVINHNMDSKAISALAIVIDQRANDVVSVLSRIEQLESMNEHTEVFIAATRRYCKMLSSRMYSGDAGTLVAADAVDLDIHIMKYGTDDPDEYDPDGEDVDEECKVLPLWFDINMLETEIVVEVLTRRGFQVLDFNNHMRRVPFHITWQRPLLCVSATELERFRSNGWRLYDPTNTITPVRF